MFFLNDSFKHVSPMAYLWGDRRLWPCDHGKKSQVEWIWVDGSMSCPFRESKQATNACHDSMTLVFSFCFQLHLVTCIFSFASCLRYVIFAWPSIFFMAFYVVLAFHPYLLYRFGHPARAGCLDSFPKRLNLNANLWCMFLFYVYCVQCTTNISEPAVPMLHSRYNVLTVCRWGLPFRWRAPPAWLGTSPRPMRIVATWVRRQWETLRWVHVHTSLWEDFEIAFDLIFLEVLWPSKLHLDSLDPWTSFIFASRPTSSLLPIFGS